MSIHEKLKELGITLPPVSPAAGAFAPAVRTGDLLFVSGHIARREGKPWVGQLGASMSTEEGKQAARGIAIELIATLDAVAGLDNVARIVKAMVLVNSVPTFTEQHLVANGASELFLEVFGDAGRHARSAFGVAQVPLGACVEIELIVELKPVA